jgi:hydrogenase maturation protease
MAVPSHHNGPCGKSIGLVTMGSILNGDDGAPRIAGAMLDQRLKDSVCIMNFDIFTYFLSDCVSAHDAVIIVDTSSTKHEPGHTEIYDLLPVLEGTKSKPSCCHIFSMLNELRLAKRSDKLPQQLTLFTIEVGEKQWGNKLSAELSKQMPDITEELAGLLHKSLAHSLDSRLGAVVDR